MVETFIYNAKITLGKASEDQSSLLVEIASFKKKTKPQNLEKKQEKKDILKNLYALFEGREKIIDAFEGRIFKIKIEGSGFSEKLLDYSNLKILTPKQMLQRLTIAVAQVKAGSTSEIY